MKTNTRNTGPTARTMRCFACPDGIIRPTDLFGTKMTYRDQPDLAIDQHVQVPRCDACGEMMLNASETKALSAILEGLREQRNV